jgi:hypothetical protein
MPEAALVCALRLRSGQASTGLSTTRHKYVPSSLLGSGVPSPLVGEGQEEGAHGWCSALHPLSLALSHEGRGDLHSQG